MYRKELPGTTVADVMERLEDRSLHTVSVLNHEIQVDLTGDETIRLGDEDDFIEMPAHSRSIEAIGGWLQVPVAFLRRIEDDLKEHLLNQMLKRTPAPATVYISSTDDLSIIDQIRDPKAKFIDPRSLVEIAGKVIDERADVWEYWVTPNEFRLDVIAPEGFDRGIGGDRKIGDVTRGGVRMGMDVKHNLAPWVSILLHRLSCTNGTEVVDEAFRVDARGTSVDEVLKGFEEAADRAFRRVERAIDSFYDLRNQKVDNPERTIVRLAEEAKLPSRTIAALVERVPAVIEDDGASMFDVVNLLTNQANAPGLRDGAQLALQRTGGQVVSDHVERCAHCRARLN